MLETRINIKLLMGKNVYIPHAATEGSAGADLRASIDEPIVLPPNSWEFISAGFAIEIPPGLFGLVAPRSGLATKGIVLKNVLGVIDSDYRGELKVALCNTTESSFTVNPLDRIAQLLILPCISNVRYTMVQELSQTTRGTGGFGSTGIA